MTDKSEKIERPEKVHKRSKADEINELTEKLDSAETKASEYLDMARRLQAEFDNFRKRTQKENEEFRKYASADILEELLTIDDDLERALQHADPDDELTKGVMGIQSNLRKILHSHDVTEIPCNGKFDANLHEAMCVTDGKEDGDIVEVFQKGYRMGDKVLRYSKVMVTKRGEDKCQE